MADLYKEFEGKIPKKLLDDVKAAVPGNIAQAKLKKILEILEEEYNKAKADPGESVGLVGAESIG